MNKRIGGTVIFAVLLGISSIGFAQNTSVDIIRQGLLGAGAGAIGGSVSGGKSEDLWVSALTGAGVNIIGGSLLDMITDNGNARSDRNTVRYVPANRVSYSTRPVSQSVYYQTTTVPVTRNGYSPEFLKGYEEGCRAGYLQGYKEAIRDIRGE